MSSFLKDPAPVALPGTKKAPGATIGGPGMYRVRLQGGSTVSRQVMKSFPSVAIVMGERIGTDRSQV
jgi:hypothetical protein